MYTFCRSELIKMKVGIYTKCLYAICIPHLDKRLYYINDTQMEELVLYWIQYKKSLKYKVGCFWRFPYIYTIN